MKRAALTLLSILALSASVTSASRQSPSTAIEIDLRDQTAFLIRNGRAVLSAPISSGREGHLTETGSFKVIEKERDHFSNLYGRIEDARGNTIVADADADMPVPRGGRFVPAPMRYFVRFNSALGMHAGYLPGYPASPGRVRLPEEKAIAIFNAVEVGTPVTVFGRTPRGREMQEARLQRPR
ncbi:MAG: L,D-transpeptidase, partial [Chthoniobacterales bacterium]